VFSLDLNGRVIHYQVRGGFAVVQGDIIVGTAAELEAARGKSLAPLSSVFTFTTALKWPEATMPYVIDSDIPNQQRILDGISHWNSRTQFKITPRTTEPNYVHFSRSTTLDAACSSYLGMIGGSQTIATTDACDKGSVIHELGHAWGLEHEQVRADRNGNVTVLYQNMDKRFIGNFDQALTSSRDTGYYDFDSIMHYPATGFTQRPGLHGNRPGRNSHRPAQWTLSGRYRRHFAGLRLYSHRHHHRYRSFGTADHRRWSRRLLTSDL
jgi:hypothetical protein